MRDVDQADVDELQRLLESVPGYAERITGYPPGPSDALSALIGCPPEFDPRDKWDVGLWSDGDLVAFADVLRGYPSADVAYVGLLIVRGDRHGRGFGRLLHDRVMDRLLAHGGMRRMRLGIIATNASVAQPFWSTLGYRPTGEEKPYRYDKLTSTVTIWERDLG